MHMYIYREKYTLRWRNEFKIVYRGIGERTSTARIQFQDPEIDKHWLITVSELFSRMAPRVATFGSSYSS